MIYTQTLLGFNPLYAPPLPSIARLNPTRCRRFSCLPSLKIVSGPSLNQFHRENLRLRCPNSLFLLQKPQHRLMTLGEAASARAGIAAPAAASAADDTAAGDAGGFSDETSSPSAADYSLASRIRGICFYAVTAVNAIFLFAIMAVAHPFVLLFDRYRRTAHHYVAKIWATLTIAPFYKFEFEGMENLPPEDVRAVYVSNHQSFLDIYTLLTIGRSFKFISKRSIFLFPIIGWAMYLMGAIPLRRMDNKSQLYCLKRCINLVKKGASVFFFPEGTRSKDGKLAAFKKGAFSVAAKTNVPVVPITLMGTGELMPAGKEGILNSGSVKVVIHKSIAGKDAERLCKEARTTIANTLLLNGYGVHIIE